MENKVKCKACETLLTKNSSGTTTHWRRHLEQCDYHKLQQKSIKQQNINFPSLDEGDVDLDAPCVSVPGYYDPTKIRDANYRWLPTPEEWNLYCEVNDALSVIHAATEEFSGSTYPTSNLFYSHIVDIKRVLGQLLKSKDPILKEMANAMLEKFEKYWGPECNTLFAVALVVDPRFKMGMINYTFPALYEETVLPKKLTNVESTLKSLHASYESELQSTSKENDATIQSTSTSLGTTSSHFSAASQFHEYMKSKNAASLPKSDLKRYLDDPVEDIPAKSFNLLQWWRMNELKYPIVAKLAKDILTIPITSVSSESAFSTGGRVISDYRSSLLPSTVQALEDDTNSIILVPTQASTANSVVGSN
uniref:OSJNBa0050F15.11 protein n=1 Tax=Oryza sativa subsp. japonica TaxID=39947 RepID=Q7XQB2_ORYSJ|nr:OSJNBa0050F15.11 [Oryza sativa Japonica Group]